jgi:hypothetical protein
MTDRFDTATEIADDLVVGFGMPVDGGYAWQWQWAYWPTAGASRTW